MDEDGMDLDEIVGTGLRDGEGGEDAGVCF